MDGLESLSASNFLVSLSASQKKKKTDFRPGSVTWSVPPSPPSSSSCAKTPGLKKKKNNRARNTDRWRDGEMSSDATSRLGEGRGHTDASTEMHTDGGARDAGRVVQGDLDVLRRLAADGRVMSCRKEKKQKERKKNAVR